MVQQESRKERRWLLPFTTGVDIPTIAGVLRLADAANATLVATSFLVTPDEQRAQHIRLELIQQSQDFLEAVHYKARRLAMPVECHEVTTCDVFAGIEKQLRDLACESVVITSRGDRPLLLHPTEIQQLLLAPPAQLVCLRLPAPAMFERPGLVSRFFAWMKAWSKARKRALAQALMSVPSSEKPYEANHTGRYEKEA